MEKLKISKQQEHQLLNSILDVEENFKAMLKSFFLHPRFSKESLDKFPYKVRSAFIQNLKDKDGSYNMKYISKMSYIWSLQNKNKNYLTWNTSTLCDFIILFNWQMVITNFPELKKGSKRWKIIKLVAVTKFTLSLRNILSHKTDKPLGKIEINPDQMEFKNWISSEKSLKITNVKSIIQISNQLSLDLNKLAKKINGIQK